MTSSPTLHQVLYLVSTPIGNYADITLRAIDVLKSSDIIICEEYKEARRLLGHYGIQKDLLSLNEHNEELVSDEIISFIKSGKIVSLISDCGTPLFSDPGKILTERCINTGIEIIPIPGANSLLPALITSGFVIDRFYYYGWLSPKTDIRENELKQLAKKRELLVLMETPYRLTKLLGSITKIFPSNTPAVLAYQLTMPEEKIFRGTIADLYSIAAEKKLKGEFVLLLDNRHLQR